MRGVILGVYNGRGVIGVEGDRRIEFSLTEWRSLGAPEPGQGVDFVEENGEARAVFATPPAPPIVPPAAPSAPPPQPQPASPPVSPSVSSGGSSTSFTLGIVGVCCLLLGFVIPIGLPTIAAFVVGVIGAAQARKDGDNTGLILSRISWITALVLLLLGILALIAIFMFWSSFGLAAIMREL